MSKRRSKVVGGKPTSKQKYLIQQIKKNKEALVKDLQYKGYSIKEAKAIANATFDGRDYSTMMLGFKWTEDNQKAKFLRREVDRMRRQALADLFGGESNEYLSEKQAIVLQDELRRNGINLTLGTLRTNPEVVQEALSVLRQKTGKNDFNAWLSDLYKSSSN